MDFSIYVETILSNLQDSGMYSELDSYDIKIIIEKHLKQEYNKKVEAAAFEYDISIAKGSVQKEEQLRKKFADIKSEMIGIVRELSKTVL